MPTIEFALDFVAYTVIVVALAVLGWGGVVTSVFLLGSYPVLLILAAVVLLLWAVNRLGRGI